MVQWLFEDYRQGCSWVAFDDRNQQVLETAWQTMTHSRPSSPDTPESEKEPELSEESFIEIEDSHFQGRLSVSPLRGFAFCDAGDLVIDRVDNETGFSEHEWIVHKLLKWKEQEFEDFDDDDIENDIDNDTKRRLVKTLSVPIGPRQLSLGDEGYGSYDSKTNLSGPQSDASSRDTQKYAPEPTAISA